MQKTINTSLTMSLLAFSLTALLTIILTPLLSFAAPSQPVLDLSPGNGAEPATPEEIERAGLVHITQPPPLKARAPEEADYFYRYRHSLTPRLGLEERFNELSNPGPVLGVLYWFPRHDLRGVEAGMDLNRDGEGVLHLASRNLVGDGKFRWFYKLGGGIRIVASDQMVTFLRLRNWLLRPGGGFEWTLSDPISLRFDLDGILSTERIAMNLTAGLSFSF